jgi:hypothetical protein
MRLDEQPCTPIQVVGRELYAYIIESHFVTINPTLQSMKPEIYAAKKTIVLIPTAIMGT